MTYLSAKPLENLILFVLASFAFMSVLGMGIGMEIMDGQMYSCPFMADQATMCQMNITEHISQWQQAFYGILTKANLLLLAIVLFAIGIIPFVKPFSQLEELSKFAARLFVYHKEYIIKIFDPFLLALSDGILNPKIYTPTHV